MEKTVYRLPRMSIRLQRWGVKVFRRHRSKNPTECSSYTAAEAAELSFSTDCNVSWQQIGSSILGLAASNQMGSHDLTEDGSLVVVAGRR